MTAVLPTPAPRPRPEDRQDADEQPQALLDAGWLQWIAEQRLRSCTPESMLATMVGAGLHAAESLRAIEAIESDPVFHAARRHQQLHAKLISVVSNLQQMWELDPRYGQVERIPEPDLQTFLRRYVLGCRPVVLTGVAADWPAMRRWSPSDLRQRFGHLEVEVQAERQADRDYETNKLAHRHRVRLADFVDRVLAGGPTNDYYLTANNELLRRPEFAPLLDDVGSLPALCDRGSLADRSSFWFGPGGTVTPLHHDTTMLFHTQVVGHKRWRFISPLETPRLYNHFEVYSPIDLDRPDLDRYPDVAGVQVLEVVAGPGDTVFLPLGWWHEVAALDVSLSFSYSNLSLPNAYEYRNPSITNW